MCLAVPGFILDIEGESLLRSARVNFSGIVREVSLACLPFAKVGDFVLVHAGLAIAVVDEAYAAETLRFVDNIV